MKRVYCIIGAGLYGLYAANFIANELHEKGVEGEVVVLECDETAFKRATYINQARVHQGYHYPRSISTALKSARYFERFCAEFDFCINTSFEKIYATSSNFSYSNATQFRTFCQNAGIFVEEINPNKFFKKNLCDGAFLTKEFTYDAHTLRDYFLEKLHKFKNVKLYFGSKICAITQRENTFVLQLNGGENIVADFVLNATYASINQICQLANFDKFKIKYELCEIILTKPNENLLPYGITVMDGPFFSIMPFGKTGFHSLTSVTFTPHSTSYDELPNFVCQVKSEVCSEDFLDNCNACLHKPKSAVTYMSSLARKYLKDKFDFVYECSLFSVKPILMSSEVDDSRPTLVRQSAKNFISVLSGKINTLYDLDEFLEIKE